MSGKHRNYDHDDLARLEDETREREFLRAAATALGLRFVHKLKIETCLACGHWGISRGDKFLCGANCSVDNSGKPLDFCG